MKIKIAIIFLLLNTICSFGQINLRKITEMQKIFFTAEVSDLAAATNNPAIIAGMPGAKGVILGYDFTEVKTQGNSSLFFLSENFGFSYQDIYNIENIRIKNYAINLSVGDEQFSIGTINRYSGLQYKDHYLNKFSIDAGIIFRPIQFISFGLLARNLGQIEIDSLKYARNYTVGVGISFLNNSLKVFADTDFMDFSRIKDLGGAFGVVIAPFNLLEFRSGIKLNPDNLLELTTQNPRIIDLKYEAFLSISILVKNSIRITSGARFNDAGIRSNYFIVLGFPFSTSAY